MKSFLSLRTSIYSAILFLGGVSIFTAYSLGADIRYWTNDSGAKALVIEGAIEAGDAKSFIALVKKHADVGEAYIFSSGGNYEEAIKIGRAMRSLEMSSNVPYRYSHDELLQIDRVMGSDLSSHYKSGEPVCGHISGIEPTPMDGKNCICASACFFIHIGGISREGNFLAVHRPYFVKGMFGKLPEVEAKKKFDALIKSSHEYMTDMGVPKSVQEDVLGTSSDEVSLLENKTIKTYFTGAIPSRYEWLKNKCSLLSDEQVARLKELQKKGNPGSRNTNVRSESEQEELHKLNVKNNAGENCKEVSISKSRKTAYKRYFAVKR